MARRLTRLHPPSRAVVAAVAVLSVLVVAVSVALATPLAEPPASADPCESDSLPGPLDEFPSARTAGVPAGTRLQTVDGDYRTTETGQVIEKLDITGRLYIDHDNVVVKCTRVQRMTTNRGVGLRMWLSTLGDSRGVGEGSALKWSNYTLRRVEIMGTYDGLKAEGNVDVRDSYIHDLYRTKDPTQESGMTHNDGVQVSAGSDMVFKNNTFYMWSFADGESAGEHVLEVPFGNGAGYMTSAFLISSGRGPVRDVLIEGNLIRGRTSKPIISVERNGYEITGLRIVDNVLGRENRDFPKVFGVHEGATVEGNTFLDGDAARARDR